MANLGGVGNLENLEQEMSEARRIPLRRRRQHNHTQPGYRQEVTPSLVRRMERRVRRRKLSPEERRVLVSARPVALLIDQMQDWTYEQLVEELRRLEYERRVAGIHPLDWYRIQAVRALIQQHELAASGCTEDEDEDEE